MEFTVEGRYFPNSLYAFTFAQIQADRMERSVEVQTCETRSATSLLLATFFANGYFGTAYPSNFRRQHLVKQ